MDESFDSVDNVNRYMNPDKVKPAHHSERDKDRKFARTLKEKMEEDLERKKKKKKRDTVVIGEPPEEKPETVAREDDKAVEVEQPPDAEPNEPDREDKQDTGHIDLKA